MSSEIKLNFRKLEREQKTGSERGKNVRIIYPLLHIATLAYSVYMLYVEREQ